MYNFKAFDNKYIFVVQDATNARFAIDIYISVRTKNGKCEIERKNIKAKKQSHIENFCNFKKVLKMTIVLRTFFLKKF